MSVLGVVMPRGAETRMALAAPLWEVFLWPVDWLGYA